MVEQERRSELEFWDGHSFDDDCHWKELNTSLKEEWVRVIEAYSRLPRI